MAAATHLRLPGDGPGRGRLGRGARGRLEGPGHRAAAPARPDRPRRQREEPARSTSRTSSSAGRASTCASWRSSRASSRPWSPRGCRCCAPSTRSRSRPRTSRSREAIAGVRADVEAGSSLEQAMERHPKVFDRLFRAMVRSGEQSGRLEEALDRIAFQVEKADALRRQVKSALMYPALVFGFATRRPDRDRRLRHPRLRQDLRRTRRRTPRRSSRPARCRRRSASRPPTLSPATGS